MNLDKRTLKILKRIYKCPYITLAEIKLIFPERNTEELVALLESERYISFRVASCAEDDDGTECFPYDDSAHLLTLLKGSIAAEDGTLFRANLALIISGCALAISLLSFIFR